MIDPLSPAQRPARRRRGWHSGCGWSPRATGRWRREVNPVSDHGVGWAKSVMEKLTLQTYSGISILDSGLVRWGFFFLNTDFKTVQTSYSIISQTSTVVILGNKGTKWLKPSLWKKMKVTISPKGILFWFLGCSYTNVTGEMGQG